MIKRVQRDQIEEKLLGNKLLLIQGPKRVRKLLLIEDILNERNISYAIVNCADRKTRQQFESGLPPTDQKVIILKGAQYLENLDQIFEDVLSGNYTFTVVSLCAYQPDINPDLLAAMQMEGLVSTIYAPSFYETATHFGLPEEERLLEERLIYGNYPSVVDDLENAEETLNDIINEAVFTRMNTNERINKGDKLMRMLQLLAFQVGETISYNDIAERCDLDNETVERYILLLENAFLLFRLPSFHTDQRYELKKSNMVYFVDNGIRNALIKNFNPPLLRNDLNALWKNYMIAERIKWLKLNNSGHTCFFWKTHTRQQIDYLEITGDGMRGYKMDWEKRKKVKFPLYFSEIYPQAKTTVINRSSYWTFLTEKFKG